MLWLLAFGKRRGFSSVCLYCLSVIDLIILPGSDNYLVQAIPHTHAMLHVIDTDAVEGVDGMTDPFRGCQKSEYQRLAIGVAFSQPALHHANLMQ